MKEELNRLFAAVENNVELQAALQQAVTKEETLTVLKAAGFKLTMQDLEQLAQEAGAELSDSDLDEVAGGNTHIHPKEFWKALKLLPKN